MWESFKKWFFRSEIRAMQEHLDWRRESMEREFAQRRQYLEDSYEQIRRMNDHLTNVLSERAMLDPGQPFLLKQDKLN